MVIYNETKGTVKLLHSPMIHMQHSVKALNSKRSREALEAPTPVNPSNFIANRRYATNEWHLEKHLALKEQGKQSSHN